MGKAVWLDELILFLPKSQTLQSVVTPSVTAGISGNVTTTHKGNIQIKWADHSRPKRPIKQTSPAWGLSLSQALQVVLAFLLCITYTPELSNRSPGGSCGRHGMGSKGTLKQILVSVGDWERHRWYRIPISVCSKGSISKLAFATVIISKRQGCKGIQSRWTLVLWKESMARGRETPGLKSRRQA